MTAIATLRRLLDGRPILVAILVQAVALSLFWALIASSTSIRMDLTVFWASQVVWLIAASHALARRGLVAIVAILPLPAVAFSWLFFVPCAYDACL